MRIRKQKCEDKGQRTKILGHIERWIRKISLILQGLKCKKDKKNSLILQGSLCMSYFARNSLNEEILIQLVI